MQGVCGIIYSLCFQNLHSLFRIRYPHLTLVGQNIYGNMIKIWVFFSSSAMLLLDGIL